MSWRSKEPGHQQPWYWLRWTEIIGSPQVKGYGSSQVWTTFVMLNLVWETSKYLPTFFNTEIIQMVEFFCGNHKDPFILPIPCHACWWPDCARSQGINSLAIGLACLQYCNFNTSRPNLLWFIDARNLGYHWFRLLLVDFLAPSHYLNQHWSIVNRTHFNKIRIQIQIFF